MRLFFAIFLFVLPFISLAQFGEKTVTFHNFNQQVNRFPEVMQFTTNLDGEFAIWKREHSASFNGKSSNVDFIELRDAEMNIIESKNIDALTKVDGGMLMGYTVVNNKLAFFTRRPALKGDEFIMSVQAIDLSSLIETEKKELFTIPMLVGPDRYTPKTMPYAKFACPLDISISPDRNFILLASRQTYDRKANEKMSFCVLDKKLDKIWSKENYEFQEEDRYYNTLSFAVDNNGIAFMLGGMNNIEKPDLDIYRFDSEDVSSIKVEYTHKPKAYQLQLGINTNNDLILTGCYSKENSKISTGNIFNIYDANTLKLKYESKNEFGDELIVYGLGKAAGDQRIEEAQKEGQTLGEYNLEIDTLLFRKDGIYLINRRTLISTYNLDGPAYVDYEIYVSKYKNNGELEYISKISRSQGINNSRLHKTYSYAATDEGIQFIFGDMLDNIERDFKTEKRLAHFSGNCLALCSIDVNGNQQRSLLYNFKEHEQKGVVMDFELSQSGNNELLVTVFLGKEEGYKYILVK